MYIEAILEDYENDEKLRKGASTVATQMSAALKGGKEAVKEHLFKMGQQPTTQLRQGRKRKNSSVIPSQQMAKSRRKFKTQGKAPAGRKPNNTNLQSQLVVGEETENVYYALPSSSQSKRTSKKHSLQQMVEENRSSED